MTKVNLDTIKPWVTRRITELLGFEDDVVIEFIFNQLDERVTDLNFCAFSAVHSIRITSVTHGYLAIWIQN